MEELEPPVKKSKKTENLDDFIENIINSDTNLFPILDEVYNKPIEIVKCYAGHFKDMRLASTGMRVLNKKLPLNELHHLKRVYKECIVLCPTVEITEPKYKSIQSFIEQNVPELRDAFDFFKEVGVPAEAPLTKKQNMQCNRVWICHFHPNLYLEKMLGDSCFNTSELRLHRTYMGMALHLASICLEKNDYMPTVEDLISSDINAAIVVDPINRSVVAIAFDNRQDHPMQHAAMLAIDNVAKTQNGGVWHENEEKLKDYTFKLRTKFFEVTFGAKKYVSKQDATEDDNVDASPYLCTGYDIYLLREPCVMCAMGLVHARVKRIFYTFDNRVLGAARSKTKLHCISSLNHKFEAFTGFNV